MWAKHIIRKNKKKTVIAVLLTTLLVVIGTIFPATFAFGESESFEEKDTLILGYAESDEEVKELSGYGEILDHYGRNVLLEVNENVIEELKSNHRIKDLDHRNELLIKGSEFDTNQGMPEIDDDLKMDDYDSETEGLYLVDLIGPVNPEWRETLEENGVDILNYIPNYAYLVRMTPEQADDLKDLFFVDWIGIYQPEFKIAEGVEPGLVSVSFSGGERSIIKITDEDQLVELANRNDVYYINQFIQPELYDEMATQTIGGGLWVWDPEEDPDSTYRGYGDYGSLATQLGHDGDGVIVAVADTGLGDGTIDDAGHPDFEGRVIGGYDYESGSYDEGEWNDENSHGTHVAGSVAGHTHGGTEETIYEDYYTAEGTAPGSGLFAVKIFDDDGEWIAGNDYHEIVEIPKQAEDAYIHSNSWGADTEGEYSASDEDFDRAVRDANRDTDENEPMIITVAAGNEGPDTNSISSPGNAKNVITVGSTGNYPYNSPEEVSSFSSRGWTDDNRVKPDVMAPGDYVYSTEPDGTYGVKSGSSMSNPAVSGAAASIVDWYNNTYGTNPNPSMVKALMINTAYDLANEQDETGENTPYIPNQDEGWGMVNLPNIVHTDVNMMLEDEDSLIETGDVNEYEIEQDDEEKPLRITLTWTDAAAEGDDPGPGPGPPLTLSEKTLNNNLNLEVESPSGEIYRGNNLVESWSVPGEDTYDTFDTEGDGWDDVNNVQNVYLRPDDVEYGTYTVRVIGEDVPSDANNDGDANQDYSLVKWNAVESLPGPLPPTDPRPEDGAIGIETDANLSVRVEHEEENNMNVSFYDAYDDSLIGNETDVQSGDRANVTWDGLKTGSKYHWYTVADDGNQTATSETWNFTTEGENYTLIIESTEGGDVTEPGEGVYEYEPGTIVDLEAKPDDGFFFVKWKGDNATIEDPTGNQTSIELLGNYTITSVFEEGTYSLNINSTEGGEVTDPGESEFFFKAGETVNIRAVSDEDYYFVEWTGNIETIEDVTESDTNITMESNYSITANFAFTEVDYILIHPDENQTITAGETIDFSAEAYDQYDELITDDDTDFTWKNTDEAGLFEGRESGQYEVTATYEGLTSDTVVVVVEEDIIDTPLEEIPGFTTMVLILGGIIAIGIYYKKKSSLLI